MSSIGMRMNELVRACFTGIWIKSYEPDEAISEIRRLCHSEEWSMMTWDIANGLRMAGTVPAESEVIDPLGALKTLSSVQEEAPTVLVLKNFHRYLASAEVVAEVAKTVLEGKQHRNFVVILSPVVQLPPELERLFIVLDHEPPTRAELRELLSSIATEPGEMPEGIPLESVLDAAVGLTRHEAENAYSLSLVRHNAIQPEAIWELKTQALKKSGLLGLCQHAGNFDSLGGLSALKAFTKRALLRNRNDSTKASPRGVLLLSPPGCGKSEFCKSLGREVGRPVLTLDVGSLMGSLVGQSEERTREALRIVDSMAPCIVMIDEVEKALSGALSGSGDSGVSSRMFGTLLSWLNDHTSDVFVVCTSNDVSRLPAEFSRAERFDGVFFLDLPGRDQKDSIWSMYRSLYGISQDESQPKDDQWTGAEIRACCRLASLLDIPLAQAAQNVVPIAVTSTESVSKLREWATGRCIDAEAGGIYSGPSAKCTSSTGATPRRRISRGGPPLH